MLSVCAILLLSFAFLFAFSLCNPSAVFAQLDHADSEDSAPKTTSAPQDSNKSTKKKRYLGVQVLRPIVEMSLDLSEADAHSIKDAELLWKDACLGLTKYLRRNAGLWGTGPFMEVLCKVGERHFMQVEAMSESSGVKGRFDYIEVKKLPKIQWKINLKMIGGSLKFKTTFSALKEKIEIGELDLEDFDFPFQQLQDADLQQLIAAYLSTQMPIRSLVTGAKFEIGAELGGRAPKNYQVTLPEKLIYFDLKAVEGAWQPEIFAVAIRSKALNSRSVMWSTNSIEKSVTKEIYFATQVGEKDELLSQIKELIMNRSYLIQETKTGFDRSSYLGIRYGRPYGDGNFAINKAPLVGLFAEFRQGLLKGVRFNYDKIDKKTVESEAGSDSLEWSRIQLGYAFGRQLNSRIINWIDLTLRLGVTNLEYHAENIDEDGFTTTANFSQFRAPTSGLELGIERRGKYFLLRGWAFGNYSAGMFSLDKNFSTTSFKVGADLYRDLFKVSRASLGIMGYASIESTRIENSAPDDAVKITDALLVDLTTVYLGGGLTVSW
ncbi:MAG: hypothetical protein NT027_09910 [Proteobacteria bacterium]|nr:hypothetical protein [Pseudomonadota bacterium]